MRRMSRVMLAALFAGIACGSPRDEDRRVAPDLRPGAVDVPEMGQTASCENVEAGVRLEYPAAWHTNADGASSGCTLFHPEPIRLVSPGRDDAASEVAITIVRDSVSFEDATAVPPGEMWLARERAVIAGREAERSEIIPGDGLLARGERTYRYHVDLGGETLIALTREVGDVPFEHKRRVLDAMMQRLELLDGAGPVHANGQPDPRTRE